MVVAVFLRQTRQGGPGKDREGQKGKEAARPVWECTCESDKEMLKSFLKCSYTDDSVDDRLSVGKALGRATSDRNSRVRTLLQLTRLFKRTSGERKRKKKKKKEGNETTV